MIKNLTFEPNLDELERAALAEENDLIEIDDAREFEPETETPAPDIDAPPVQPRFRAGRETLSMGEQIARSADGIIGSASGAVGVPAEMLALKSDEKNSLADATDDLLAYFPPVKGNIYVAGFALLAVCGAIFGPRYMMVKKLVEMQGAAKKEAGMKDVTPKKESEAPPEKPAEKPAPVDPVKTTAPVMTKEAREKETFIPLAK